LHTPPDVILMGVDLTGRTGAEEIEHVKNHYPAVPFVLLISEADQELVVRALHAGVDGFLMKNLYAEQLNQALRDAQAGQSVLSGEIAQLLVRSLRQSSLGTKAMLAEAMEESGIYVSETHVEVAFLLIQGYANKEIAPKMELQ